MIGIKTVASWAVGAFRLTERSSFRILGAARTPTFNPAIESDRMQKSMVNGLLTSKHRPYSQFCGSEIGKKTRSYWSAVAAGLLGIGGVSLVCDIKNEKNIFNEMTLFPTAYCDPDEKCVCDEEKPCGTSDCLRKTEKEEELIKQANAELEKALRDTKGKAVEFTEAALKAYCDAIEALNSAMSKVYCAVEEENLDSPRFEDVWCDVYDALLKRCELAKSAMDKGQCAWELLIRLRDVIDSGKCCKLTACNPLLKTAEGTLKCAEQELCSKKTLMDQLLKESRVAEQYRNIVEDFRRDLKAEAESLVPSEDCRVTLTDNEADMALTHAYKKILRSQMELGGGKC